jgi:hypothetical protein
MAPDRIPRSVPAMKFHAVFLGLAVSLLSLPRLGAQNPAPGQPPATPQGTQAQEAWRGFLSIDYRGGRFVMPYAHIVSISRASFLIDGGGKVHEVTIDTQGGVIARYYFLESLLENNPLNAAQIVNARMKSLGNLAEQRTGEEARQVIKHYPDTTHAKTVEFNLTHLEHLDAIFGHVTRKWIDEGGRGPAETLRF